MVVGYGGLIEGRLGAGQVRVRLTAQVTRLERQTQRLFGRLQGLLSGAGDEENTGTRQRGARSLRRAAQVFIQEQRTARRVQRSRELPELGGGSGHAAQIR